MSSSCVNKYCILSAPQTIEITSDVDGLWLNVIIDILHSKTIAIKFRHTLNLKKRYKTMV